MVKAEKDYLEQYGDIPRDELNRLDIFLKDISLSRAKRKVTSEIMRISSIKWKTITFILYLVPKATPRPRGNFESRVFYVSGGKSNKDFFRKEFLKLNLDMIYTPMKFHSRSYLPISRSMSPVDQILAELGYLRPISKPDFDNLVKTYTDMITATLIYDDALIIDGRSEKYYSWKPRVEITIEYMEDFDCDFNKKKIKER